MLNSTSIPPLKLPEFQNAGLNLNTLGLNPTNPAADRVRDGLQALRQTQSLKATSRPIAIRQRVPGLSPAAAKELGQAIANSQMGESMGVEGKKVSLEVAVRLADVLDVYHAYYDMLQATTLDLSKVPGYLDPRCWAVTPRYVQQLVKQHATAERTETLKQVKQEIDNLTGMLDALDRMGGTALELFERRRMQREGLRPRAIEKAIAEMKADGRIPVVQEGGPAA